MVRDPQAVSRAATSVIDRIKATARNRETDPRKLIIRYALERWLHRLGQGKHAAEITLKGGMMMPMLGDESRPTEDIDCNTPFDMTSEEVAEFVREVSSTPPSEEDGLEFDTSTMRVEGIREGLMPGARVTFAAFLRPSNGGATEIRMKLDLTHGDAITPDAVMGSLPSAIKGFEPVTMSVYPWPTIVAEKLHAVARFGVTNSRLKDFYDLLLLARSMGHDGGETCRAVAATFRAWGETRIEGEPPGLSDDYAAAKENDWKRFLRQERGLKLKVGTLGETIAEIRGFVGPVLEAASRGESLESDWVPGGGWTPRAPGPAMTA